MLTYKKAGVSVEKGNAFVGSIAQMTKGMRKVDGGTSLGGFASIASFPKGYKNPQMVLATDGVGTKILLCKEANTYDTVGIDLVAMSVNDILTLGAEPYLFLDYYATSKLNLKQSKQILKGIIKGCQLANCALVGGETAEMPGVYKPGDFDLAGFCVGVLEKGQQIDGSKAKKGDLIIGLPSSGLHSNGYSLARAILEHQGCGYSDHLPFDKKQTWAKALLKPTKIYVSDILPLLKKKKIKAMAHITGGGIVENLVRVLPEKLQARIDTNAWKTPSLFQTLQQMGQVKDLEMYRTFNMGIGFVLIVSSKDASAVLKAIKGAKVIGTLEKGEKKVVLEGASC